MNPKAMMSFGILFIVAAIILFLASPNNIYGEMLSLASLVIALIILLKGLIE